MLRWLHVGSKGYIHSCIPTSTAQANHLSNNMSSAAFADDLACLTGNISDLHTQADKITRYSNWAKLQVSGSKTKVTGILHGTAKSGIYGQAPESQCRKLLKTQLDQVMIQGQGAQSLESNESFLYLGVELTMDLDWSHQLKRMTSNLQTKLDGLLASYASARQVQSIIATAIILSLAYAFPVTP